MKYPQPINGDDTINVAVEIPMGTRNKLEVDEYGRTWVDRVVMTPYPVNYGYIGNTLAKDGDPLDVVLYSEDPLPTGAFVRSKVYGYLEVYDNGVADHKVIARPVWECDMGFNPDSIKSFFSAYKEGVRVGALHAKESAINLIEESALRARSMGREQMPLR